MGRVTKNESKMAKLSFYSIKFQMLIAFTLLVLPLVALTYFLSLSHQLFNRSLDSLIEIEEISRLLSEVEKDIVDLQRNVLIFKETASQGAADKVAEYHQNVDARISRLLTLEQVALSSEQIQIMQQHLADYKENFDVVVGMRNQRTKLIGHHLNTLLLVELAPEVDGRGALNTATEINNNLLSAHNASLSYFTSFDPEDIGRFKSRLAVATKAIKEFPNPNAQALDTLLEVEAYEKNFLRIVALTRHYVYLINVVMTGSANEIQFNARSLDDIFLAEATRTRINVATTLNDQRLWSGILSFAGMAIASLVAVMFYFRITRPIERITKVFECLARGDKVVRLTEHNRRDEIGKLALAAEVFKSKNEQTTSLLIETERMVREQKLLNQEISQEKQRAERALSIKTEFLANMSHELRTPLNSVIGFTVRLLKQSDKANPRQIKALESIERNGRHLLAMINDILDLSKIEANKLDINVVDVDIGELCNECIMQIGAESEEKGLELIYSPVDVPSVKTDPSRMSQILLNLLSNSIKYTERGYIKVEVSTGYGGRSVTVKVIDSGVGITTEDQNKLFQRFEQFDEHSRYEVGSGSGLGLAIVANLARLLGVSLSVSSEFGVGSCFAVRVPVDFSVEEESAILISNLSE